MHNYIFKHYLWLKRPEIKNLTDKKDTGSRNNWLSIYRALCVLWIPGTRDCSVYPLVLLMVLFILPWVLLPCWIITFGCENSVLRAFLCSPYIHSLVISLKYHIHRINLKLKPPVQAGLQYCAKPYWSWRQKKKKSVILILSVLVLYWYCNKLPQTQCLKKSKVKQS